jgi:hypothetical protein
MITLIQSVYYGRLIHINSLCIMADWYTSIQSLYYGILIHISSLCIMADWYTSIPQYSLCIMADRHFSIQSVYYSRLIHISSVCVMADWYISILSVYCGRLIHLIQPVYYGRQIHRNTVCVLWHTGHPQSVAIFVELISVVISVFIWHPIHVAFTFTIYLCWPATLSATCCLPMESRALLQWAFYITSFFFSCWTSLGIIW